MADKVIKYIGLQSSMPDGVTTNFADLNLFDNWISAQDLVALDIWVEALVYSNQTDTSTANTNMHPITYDETHYCIVKPGPGIGWMDLNAASGVVDYYTTGIELAVNATTSPRIQIGNGVIVDGFRIKVQESATPSTTGQYGIEMRRLGNTASWPNTIPGKLRRCLLLSEVSNAGNGVVRIGMQASVSTVEDCVFFQSTGSGKFVNLYASAPIQRNTFIRRDTSTGSAVENDMNTGSTMRDLVFVGCSNTPIVMVAGANAALITNNFTDTALATAHAGITYSATLGVTATDAKPAAESPVLNAASSFADDTYDVRNIFRGQVADAGAVQASVPAAPPTGTVTDQPAPDGQSQRFAGTTSNATSGTYSLSSSNGGVDVGPLAFTVASNAFDFTHAGLEPGDYTPTLSVTGAGGTALVSGAGIVSILPVGGGGSIVTDPGDTDAPVMSGAIAISQIKESSFVGSWTAATDNVGVVGYEYSLGGAYLPLGLVTSSLFDAQPVGAPFTLSIRALDGAGLRSNILTATDSTLAAQKPGEPTNVVATLGTGQTVSVAFVPGTKSIENAVTSFTVKASNGQTISGTVSPIEITMPTGFSGTFKVSATNIVGESLDSASSNVVSLPTAATAPDAPTAVSAVAWNGFAVVSFTPPVSDGGSAITSFEVEASSGQKAVGTSSPITVVVPDDIPVSFVVRAINIVGPSLASTASAAVTPTAPANSFTPSIARTITVQATGVAFSAQGSFWTMTDPKKPRGVKDPNATIDIPFDWLPWLGDISDTISSVEFIVDGGLVIEGFGFIGSVATIFVSGGTISQQTRASITCRITTASNPSRIEDRTVYLDIEAR